MKDAVMFICSFTVGWCVVDFCRVNLAEGLLVSAAYIVATGILIFEKNE